MEQNSWLQVSQKIAILVAAGINGQIVAGGKGMQKLKIDSPTLASHPLNYESYFQLLRDIKESFFVLSRTESTTSDGVSCT